MSTPIPSTPCILVEERGLPSEISLPGALVYQLLTDTVALKNQKLLHLVCLCVCVVCARMMYVPYMCNLGYIQYIPTYMYMYILVQVPEDSLLNLINILQLHVLDCKSLKLNILPVSYLHTSAQEYKTIPMYVHTHIRTYIVERTYVLVHFH